MSRRWRKHKIRRMGLEVDLSVTCKQDLRHCKSACKIFAFAFAQCKCTLNLAEGMAYQTDYWIVRCLFSKQHSNKCPLVFNFACGEIKVKLWRFVDKVSTVLENLMSDYRKLKTEGDCSEVKNKTKIHWMVSVSRNVTGTHNQDEQVRQGIHSHSGIPNWGLNHECHEIK